MYKKGEVKTRNPENVYAKVIRRLFRLRPFVNINIHKFTPLHLFNILHFQHDNGNCRGQLEVTVVVSRVSSRVEQLVIYAFF